MKKLFFLMIVLLFALPGAAAAETYTLTFKLDLSAVSMYPNETIKFVYYSRSVTTPPGWQYTERGFVEIKNITMNDVVLGGKQPEVKTATLTLGHGECIGKVQAYHNGAYSVKAEGCWSRNAVFRLVAVIGSSIYISVE
ncbi:MAG: hypothetical protein PHG91_08865 [Syntrophales bacterium]|nr:hypothetical protein [Syntrophales bacterium]MDD5233494.1 hypothetical protein [Syntrophales bacterium]MDD5533859.1 hypothetical protein [Syntrophales bacterium]